jgi:thiamine biosynthesis lipoprotein
MRKVEHIMGMAITVDIPDCDNPKIFTLVFKHFKQIDNRFSTYKENSELSRHKRGELNEKDLSEEFREVMKACKEANKMTDGYFSAYFSEKYDPTGYVKGWAISEAGKVIEKNNLKTYCIGAGGDILARSNSDKIWNVGIQNPRNKQEIIETISDKNFAVATSGNYERGRHIFNPKTKKVADNLLSVTVLAPDIITADIYATAIFAEGLPGLTRAEEKDGLEALAIDKGGKLYMSSGMEESLQLI